MFADSRYWQQAERELAGSGIELVKLEKNAPDAAVNWLVDRLQPGQRLGADAQVLALGLASLIAAACKTKGLEWVSGHDPFAAAWPERPGLPAQAGARTPAAAGHAKPCRAT